VKEEMENLFREGKELTLVPILSKTKPEPFYGWKPVRITVDRYSHIEETVYDTEERSFPVNKYKLR
jgi:hypothetical protein